MLAKGAVNPRRMRRIIADDPSWNRDRVPTLVNLCINAIVCNFKDHPILHELPPEFAYQVLNELPTSLPLELAVRLIDDDGYWKRAAAIMTDKVHDVTKHGNSWKRLFFEKYVQRMLLSYNYTCRLFCAYLKSRFLFNSFLYTLTLGYKLIKM